MQWGVLFALRSSSKFHADNFSWGPIGVSDRGIDAVENDVDFQSPIQSPCLIFSGIATSVKQNL
jgi:hypothetical protein